jgi:hypothetical protein
VKLAAVALLLCCSCAPTLSGWGHDAAQGALAELSSDAGLEAIAAARDEALGPATDIDLQAIVRDTGATTRQQLSAAEDELQGRLLDALGPATEARVAALREQLVGAPLRADLDALIDQETPRLAAALQGAIAQSVQASLAPVKAEEERWRPIAWAFAIGSAFLLVGLVFAVIVLRSHRKVIEALAAAKG